MPSKPNLIDRRASYMSIPELDTVIDQLEEAYEATRNEKFSM